MIERDHELASVGRLGNKLAKRALPNAPLIPADDLASVDHTRLRVDTVHQAKGESLDAVLYVTKKDHAEALLSGVEAEVGRIDYVAVTRARDLLWLGVPASSLEEMRPALLDRGFQEVGAPAATQP